MVGMNSKALGARFGIDRLVGGGKHSLVFCISKTVHTFQTRTPIVYNFYRQIPIVLNRVPLLETLRVAIRLGIQSCAPERSQHPHLKRSKSR